MPSQGWRSKEPALYLRLVDIHTAVCSSVEAAFSTSTTPPRPVALTAETLDHARTSILLDVETSYTALTACALVGCQSSARVLLRHGETRTAATRALLARSRQDEELTPQNHPGADPKLGTDQTGKPSESCDLMTPQGTYTIEQTSRPLSGCSRCSDSERRDAGSTAPGRCQGGHS